MEIIFEKKDIEQLIKSKYPFAQNIEFDVKEFKVKVFITELPSISAKSSTAKKISQVILQESNKNSNTMTNDRDARNLPTF